MKITKKNLLKFLPYIFLFSLSVALSYSKTSGWVVSSLEMLKLRRSFNAAQTLFKYFPNIIKWFLKLRENGVEIFSLVYILPAPFLYFLGEEYGLKLFYSVFGGLNAAFSYFFILKIFKPSNKKHKIAAFLSILMLVLSWGFSALSGLCLMDPVMVFFMLASFYFFIKEKYFWFGAFFTLSTLSKDPVFTVIPGFIIYALIYQKRLFKNKKIWLSILINLALFLGIKKLAHSGGRFALENTKPIMTSPQMISSFYFVHLKNIFISAPIILIFGILGMFNLTKNEKSRLMFLVLAVLSMAFFYFSAITKGVHYIYFTFPFLAIFSYVFLRKVKLKNLFIIFFLNALIFIFSYYYEPIFSRFHKTNIPEVKAIVESSLEKGEFIITHAGVWDYYLWHKPYAVIKDIEWYGDVDINKSKIPQGYIDNTSVILIKQSQLNQLAKWNYIDDFKLVKQVENWVIFTRKESR
jgi:4-amino-4-deoxy-L-arabinose transferase-like glycosyltransferase